MKTRKLFALLALLIIFVLRTAAQETQPPLKDPNYNKTRIFADLPDKMPLRVADLESLLELPVGSRVNVTLSRDLSIVGHITSKSNPADATVRSVVIKTTNRQGSTFTFTRVTAADGTVSYIGRMLNRAGIDALEIAKEGQGYVIRKKGIYDLMNE